MTGLNHAATGITIALLVKRPEFALPVALLSHFVLDMIPHSLVAHSKKIMTPYLIAEAILCTALTIACMVAFPEYWLLIGFCAVFAFLPDFFWPFFYNGMLRDKPFFKKFYVFHKKIQWSETYRGWLVEILYFSAIAIFLVNYQA